ncbi:MAG TPA: hypothetical protein VEV62_11850, partial [Parafilimonas sp.]|nr:hypothetical protein [Parafilimonas sp.]
MRKYITTIVFLFAVVYVSSQNLNNYRAVHWGLDEGLSQGETYHVIKDVNGFLWIGTRYGLNRFDGNSFKLYTHQRNNNKSLLSNEVIGGLVEDSLHNIWIGSNKGLSRYNIKADDFTNFFCDTTFYDDPEISPFWATKNEVFCIESESLITAYDIHSSAKKVIGNLDSYKRKIIGIATTYSIFDSNTNSVWCLVENNEGKAGLLQVMLSTGDKNFFAFIYKVKQNSQGFAEDMCYDAVRKCIWVNSTEGLLQFTLVDKQFHHINALYKYEQLKDYTRFVGIALDKQDRVWFSTDPKGIIVYNPADKSVTSPFPADSITQHDVSNANCCIYCDRDNIIWTGFWLRKGIYALVPYLPVVKYYAASPKKDSLNSPYIITALDAGKGKIWIGTGQGINILDIKTGSFKALQQKDFPGLQTPRGVIGAIAIDTGIQKAWLFTFGTFFKADMLTRKCTPIILKTLGNKAIPVAGIPVFDGKEIFFLAQYNDSAHVAVLNLTSDTAHEIFSFRSNPFYIRNTVAVENHFLFLQGYADEKDNQTYENKNGKWMRIYTPIDSARWTSIAHIRDNDSYWVAGENKLVHFDNRFHI